jgi:hypothetical protein
MSKKIILRNQVLLKPARVNFVKTVPFESGFHFFRTLGDSTGVTATSLNEFAGKLRIVPTESVLFHFQRKDFQKWIKGTIKDTELAEKIDGIKEETLPNELRTKILRITQEHIIQPKILSPRENAVKI